jgi:hypothetical protein
MKQGLLFLGLANSSSIFCLASLAISRNFLVTTEMLDSLRSCASNSKRLARSMALIRSRSLVVLDNRLLSTLRRHCHTSLSLRR